MKICPNCHAAVQDDAMFCTSCGTPLEQNTAPTEPLTSNQPEQPNGILSAVICSSIGAVTASISGSIRATADIATV